MSDSPAAPGSIDQNPPTTNQNVCANVKSPGSPDNNQEDESDSGDSSPPPNCAICLCRCRNKCFTDSCLHQFCFHCLLEWSKHKPECPLCKQSFKSIIHNVRSIDQFDEYLVEPQQPVPVPLPMSPRTGMQRQVGEDGPSLFAHRFDVFLNDIPRFSASFQIQSHNDTLHQYLIQRTSIAELLRQQHPNDVITTGSISLLWRQYIYDRRLYALPIVDITGRYRECSARFLRNNPAQIHRLIPFLNRELICLLRATEYHVSYVLHVMNQMLSVYNINSSEFRRRCSLYIGTRTAHFIHEFLTFARSPFDMIGYDRQARYAPYEEIIISSTSSGSEHEDELEQRHLQAINHSNPTTSGIEQMNPNNTRSVYMGSLSNPMQRNIAFSAVSNFVANAQLLSQQQLQQQHQQPLQQLQPLNHPLIQQLHPLHHQPHHIIQIQQHPLQQLPQQQRSYNSNFGHNAAVNQNDVVLSSGSSDECEFVLEQKPPHLRTPELVSLHSESDSDVIFVSENKLENKVITPPVASQPAVAKPLTKSVRNLTSSYYRTRMAAARLAGASNSTSEDEAEQNTIRKNQKSPATTNVPTSIDSNKKSNDEINNGASTSTDIELDHKRKIREIFPPQRQTRGKKRRDTTDIFWSSSDDDNDYNSYSSGDSFDFPVSETDSDDSSWSLSRHRQSRAKQQKKRKYSKKRQTDVIKKKKFKRKTKCTSK